jgi:hypothetical protein
MDVGHLIGAFWVGAAAPDDANDNNKSTEHTFCPTDPMHGTPLILDMDGKRVISY